MRIIEKLKDQIESIQTLGPKNKKIKYTPKYGDQKSVFAFIYY